MADGSTSVVRWAGSKRKILPVLRRAFEGSSSTGKYIEPFAGSAALYFDLQPPRAVLADTNPELIAALKKLKDDPRPLYDEIVSIPVSEEMYYAVRSGGVSASKEARFFYLNRLCFNGIYRTNKSGAFNVPYGGPKAGKIPPLERWLDCSAALQGASIIEGDFEEVVRNSVQAGDFVYLDPPYAVSNRRIFKQYTAAEFGIDDVRRLAALLHEINDKKGRFLVSYAMSPETSIIASDWKVARTIAQRNVAGFAMHRRKAVEVLISNF